jgi:outer membrane murein-binding lipoprotein Lpp
MKINLSTLSFRTVFYSLFGLFLFLFICRLGYNLTRKSTSENQVQAISFFENQPDIRKNYASEKSTVSFNAPPPPPGGAQATQKYEKTATLNARTDEFPDDENKLRQTTQAFGAIIQYEQKSGNPGHRDLHLMIGVRPELFDSFYVVAQGIGHIYVNSITKVDKTTEFRELNAKKASLEKALSNLTDLKNRAGSIADLVGLHDKILDIERQMQELGVELGNFSAENEFCTVRFSLSENAAARSISFARHLFDAFTWTVQYYLLLLLALIFMLAAAWLVLVVGAKIKQMGSV